MLSEPRNIFATVSKLAGLSDTYISHLPLPLDVLQVRDSSLAAALPLSSITIPGSVKYISDYAFQNCTGLGHVTFAKTTGWYIRGGYATQMELGLLRIPAEAAKILREEYCTQPIYRID